MINGKPGHCLNFQNVLHVPLLRNNLLAVLYLTRQKQFHVSIWQNKLKFKRDRKLLLTATIDDSNTGYLDGYPVPVTEYAGLAHHTASPLNLSLWHRRFAHLNIGDIQEIIKKKMVTGIQISDTTPPDPICEPCLAGKQHRGPIPKVAQHRATKPLELIHSDLHGPLPVQAKNGSKYWVTFIDDATRFWSVVTIRQKSDTFAAFKAFNATPLLTSYHYLPLLVEP